MRSIVNPVSATQNVCLWNNATPSRIKPNMINSILIGPIDGTSPDEPKMSMGDIINMIAKKDFFRTVDLNNEVKSVMKINSLDDMSRALK